VRARLDLPGWEGTPPVVLLRPRGVPVMGSADYQRTTADTQIIQPRNTWADRP